MEITKPEVDYPEGTPPKALEITDIWEGDGKVAGAGDTLYAFARFETKLQN